MPNRFGDAHKAGNFGIIAAGRAGIFNRIWMAALLASLSQFGTVHAQESTPPTELLYQFQRPASPGDSFSLRFWVPAGYQSAVVICDKPGPSTGPEPPGSPDIRHGLIASIDGARASFLLLPDSETGLACLNGRLPEDVSLPELSRSAVSLHIFLANHTTGDYLISDPIPLSDAPTPPNQEETETSHDVATDSILSVADLATGTESDGSDGTSDTGASSSFRSDTSSSASQQFQPLPLASSFGGGTFGFSSHDQPIPIQGSGH